MRELKLVAGGTTGGVGGGILFEVFRSDEEERAEMVFGIVWVKLIPRAACARTKVECEESPLMLGSEDRKDAECNGNPVPASTDGPPTSCTLDESLEASGGVGGRSLSIIMGALFALGSIAPKSSLCRLEDACGAGFVPKAADEAPRRRHNGREKK